MQPKFFKFTMNKEKNSKERILKEKVQQYINSLYVLIDLTELPPPSKEFQTFHTCLTFLTFQQYFENT